MTDSAENQHQRVKFHHSLVLRQLHARPFFFISIAVAMASYFLLPQSLALRLTTRLLLSWNFGVYLYLLLAGIMILRSSEERMRWRAQAQDEGRVVVLVGVILATLACLASIFAELAAVKDIQGTLKYAHIFLTVATIVSSWLFIHLMFALHYAHDYYSAQERGDKGGLLFPGTTTPNYGDFLYFAAVIGTSGQTADVSFTSQPMRRIGLVHCVLAYMFNTTVLALAINIASSLF
ncbi:MAG: DUF1345 domain-containing protein [Betaproteobacteria bacterium]|nr:DUF1345 domain-containing protein [Betaproteobacteria bacterium]